MRLTERGECGASKILLRQRGDSIVADGLGADSLGQGREGSIVIDGARATGFLVVHL